MSFVKVLGPLLAASSFMFASAAYATPVNVVFTGQNGGSTVAGGGFDITVEDLTPNNTNPVASFVSWCIDLGQNISFRSQGFNYEATRDNALTGTPTGNSAPAISNTEVGLLSRLFTSASGGPSTNTGSANDAFQVAIWEIIYDGDSGLAGLDLSTGAFSATQYGQAVVDAAQALLDGLATALAESYSFVYLLSGTNQDQIVGFQGNGGPLGNTPQVPLPAGAVLLIGALGAFAAVRRKKPA